MRDNSRAEELTALPVNASELSMSGGVLSVEIPLERADERYLEYVQDSQNTRQIKLAEDEGAIKEL